MLLRRSEPIESIIGRIYGPPESRKGDRSGRLWWICPFHDDKNPSFCVTPGSDRYHCFGCGVHGDAIDFVRRLNPGISFREAVELIEGRDAERIAPPCHRPRPDAPRPLTERPGGWQEFVREIVAKAEETLWSDRGGEARGYLDGRGLSEATIRAARLGCWPADQSFAGIFADRKVWVPRGIMIPWFDGPDVALVNVRRSDGDPKYIAILGSRRGGLYPGRGGIAPGQPVVIVEGEFDALLLGQELLRFAPVVTLGAAGTRPAGRVLGALLPASPWIVAVDSDQAGEKSADAWMSRSERCIRISPPPGMKDWTEVRQAGVGLRALWQPILERIILRSSPLEMSPPTPSDLTDASGEVPAGYCVVDGVLAAEPPPCPWRDPIGGWPDDWRLRWGVLANTYCHEGMKWREGEIRAAIEVTTEKEAAGGWPALNANPHPGKALWRDILVEMLDSGEAAQTLSSAELRQARDELLNRPLDYEALRRFGHAVMSRGRIERLRVNGITEMAKEGRWRCQGLYCRDKSRWWMSEYGVVYCLNCVPPSFPERVIVEGKTEDAPFVERGRSNQARAPFPRRRASTPILPDPSSSAASDAPIPCVGALQEGR